MPGGIWGLVAGTVSTEPRLLPGAITGTRVIAGTAAVQPRGADKAPILEARPTAARAPTRPGPRYGLFLLTRVRCLTRSELPAAIPVSPMPAIVPVVTPPPGGCARVEAKPRLAVETAAKYGDKRLRYDRGDNPLRLASAPVTLDVEAALAASLPTA